MSFSIYLFVTSFWAGDYSKAFVYLENNKLTEFREDVFKSMLQQMAAQPVGSGGQVFVTGSNFKIDLD
jgi:hypothetical protein